MRIFLDIDSRRLYSGPGKPLTKLEFKRRDNDAIELIFLRENIAQELPAGTTAKVGVKVDADYASDFLAVTTVTQSGTGTDTVYTGELNFNTTEMSAAFAAEPVTLAAMLEVEWLSGTALSSSKTLPVVLHNDVIRGDEGDPATLPIFYAAATTDFQATQEQAEAGTDSTTWMSPLRTAQAIAALSGTGGVSSYNDLTDVPAEFAPEAHTHALSDITQSGATTGQVATWDGTSWVPQDVSGGGGGTTVNLSEIIDDTGGDVGFVPQFNGTFFEAMPNNIDASQVVSGTFDIDRIPTGTTSSTVALGNHTHTNYAATSHNHAASDITTGTIAIARIPTGTTFSTVALGNHTHSEYAATSHTHAIADVTGLQSELDAIDTKVAATGGFTTISVVSTLPVSPDPSTIYIITS